MKIVRPSRPNLCLTCRTHYPATTRVSPMCLGCARRMFRLLKFYAGIAFGFGLGGVAAGLLG